MNNKPPATLFILQWSLCLTGLPTSTNNAKVEIGRHSTIRDLEELIAQLFPSQPLRLVGFTFGHCDKGRKVTTLPTVATVRALEAAVKKGRLLIIPNRDLPMPPTLPSNVLVEVLLTEFLS